MEVHSGTLVWRTYPSFLGTPSADSMSLPQYDCEDPLHKSARVLQRNIRAHLQKNQSNTASHLKKEIQRLKHLLRQYQTSKIS